jgi:predicted nucleotidyltransferase
LLEECSIYIFISLILIEGKLNTETLRKEIIKLLSEENMKVYKEQLGDEYSKFAEDVKIVKKNLSR